jgi:hypothetical protein
MKKTSCAKVLPQSFCFSHGVASFTAGGSLCLICGGVRGCAEHKFLPHADSRVIPILHSPISTGHNRGVTLSTWRSYPIGSSFSAFSILRGGVTTLIVGTPLEHKVYMEWRMRRRLRAALHLEAGPIRCVRGLKPSLVIGQKAQIGPNPFTPRGRADLVV